MAKRPEPAPSEGEPQKQRLTQALAEARQATENAQRHFRLLVDSVREYGIFLLDPEGYIRSWNTGAERIKGYAAREIIGKHFSTFYSAEDLKRGHPQFELEQALRNGRYEEEGWRIRKDGSRFWASIVITALKDPDGTHVGFAKVTRDLTERRESEERLKASEARARKMFEGVKDYAMILLDPDGTIASWNEGARRIKGYEPAEIIGKHFSLFYPEQDVQMGKCEYELKEAADTGRFEDEGWRVRKDGTRFWASVLITTIRDDQGKVLGFSKVTRDITDRKRAEDLLKMAHANLEKRVAERTRQLTAANEELKAAVEARDEFLSIASHELRTPITPLRLQIQAIMGHVKRKTLASLPEDRIDRMSRACDQSLTRLVALLENLLDVSRINSGKLVLNRESFDLADMVRDVCERYKSDIASSGSELKFESIEPVFGTFDRLRMEQAFVNLLTNALKYGAGGPIQIEVRAEKNQGILEVRDSGLGIAQSDQERIFERFERVQSVGSIGGLGLGLYITRQVVEAHGGQISVKSSRGQGSTFMIVVPLASEEKP